MSERVRILHVEDDPEFAELTTTFLEQERPSFGVDTAADATEGLELLADSDYDCIVSDYDMPGRTGIEFLETVREGHPDLPFILFTGKGSEAVASEAVSAGVTDYLQKGGSSDRYALLANRIENAVSAHRTAQRATRQEHLMRHAEVVGETGGWEIDAQTGELHCTVGTRHVLGVPECEEPTSFAGLVEYYHPDDRPEVRTTVERVRATGEEAAGEWRLQTVDGDQRLVEMTIHPVTADGEVVALRGAIHDITERRERKDRLRENRAVIEQALDALDDLFYVVGTDGTLRRWNDTLRDVTGYSDAELAEMAVTEFVASSDRSRLAGAVEAALTAGRATVAAELVTADGERVPYEFTGSRLTDGDGEPVGIAGVGRRRDAYGGRPDLAEMVLQHAPDPTVLVDVTDCTEFHIEAVNPAYESLTGLDADQVRGRRPTAVFGDEFGDRIEAQYRNCIEQQRPTEYTECWPVDGEPHEWETKLAPVVRNGGVVALVGVKRDVTGHKRREGTLERYEYLVENLPVGVFRATPDGEFVSVNEALVSIYDAGSKAALRTAGSRALYADPAHRELLLDQLDDEGTVEGKLVRMESLDGEDLWVELSLSLVDDDGRYIDGVVREVTDHDRETAGTEALELLADPGSEPLFLVDVGEKLRLQHVDTTPEDVAGDVADIHSGALTAPDGGDAPTLAASRAGDLRACVRTREPRTFDGVSPLTGNPVDGTAHVVPVVVDGGVEYLVGVLERDQER